jgi:hypothetical protein
MLAAVPDLEPHYEAACAACDGDVDLGAFLELLADEMADLLERIDALDAAVCLVLEGIEALRGHGQGTADLVRWAFLDALSPTDRRRLSGAMGPWTRDLSRSLDELEAR